MFGFFRFCGWGLLGCGDFVSAGIFRRTAGGLGNELSSREVVEEMDLGSSGRGGSDESMAVAGHLAIYIPGHAVPAECIHGDRESDCW